MSNELQGLSVIVTRPTHQAAGFCQLVEDAGGQVIRFPVIEIQPITLDKVAREALSAHADCMIFISANAARLGVETLKRLAPQRLAQNKIMAIGKATALELERLGFTPDLVPPSPYNSEALLAMPEMQTVDKRCFTIFKGKGGRAHLMEQLRARGGTVKEVNVYERVKPQQSNAVLQQIIDCERAVVSVTSVKGLHFLFEMVSSEQGQWIKEHALFLVPGSRVADAAHDLHIRCAPIVADNATDAAMLDRLLRFIA